MFCSLSKSTCIYFILIGKMKFNKKNSIYLLVKVFFKEKETRIGFFRNDIFIRNKMCLKKK